MKSSVLSLLRLAFRRPESVLPKQPKSIYEVLSRVQAAYTVFPPKPCNFFNLFDIIFLHHERPISPLNTNTNLQQIFQDLQHEPDTICDESLLNAFLSQFTKVYHEEFSQKPKVMVVSAQSLREAGVNISTPITSVISKASRYHIAERKLRMLWLSTDEYTGRKELQKLIWKHAEAVFLLILRGLDSSHFLTEPRDKGIMGIVTKRIISEVNVSQVDEKGTVSLLEMDCGSVPAGAGIKAEKSKVLQEEYEDIGVSGVLFIIFKIECIDRHQWRVYRGIEVCDSELNEEDDFNEAVNWHRGIGGLKSSVQSDYKNVTDDDPGGSGAHAKNATNDSERAYEERNYVYLTYDPQVTPFVDIDIRPFLSDFANEQCKLAARYRKMDRSNPKKATQAVLILRSVLRKCCFESTVRALYDLSGCYFHGIGVKMDGNLGWLLRQCAAGMRRSFDMREWWLKRLVVEIGSRRDNAPERSIGSMALLSHWRRISTREDTGKLIYIHRMTNDITTTCRRKDEEFGRFTSSSESGKQQITFPPVQVAPHSKPLSTIMSGNDDPTSHVDTFGFSGHIRRMKAAIQEQFRSMRKEYMGLCPRILLVGRPKVGKSTLVNTMFGLGAREQAKVRAGGRLCTRNFAEYGPFDFIPVIFLDSHNIEKEISEDQRNDLLSYVRTKNFNPNIEDNVHVGWYIPGEKWEASDTLFVEMLRKVASLNVVIVLTKCDLRMQIDKRTSLTSLENTKRVISKAVPGVPIVECATPPKGSLHWVPRSCPRGHGREHFFIDNFDGTWICRGDKIDECEERGRERTGPFGYIELVERTLENVPEIVRKSLLEAQVVV